jgi:hypothetical protein
MNFEGQSGTGSQEICDLFARFIERTNANKPWVPSDPRLDDVSDEPPFRSLQFTVLEVLTALLDLDSNKGPGSDSAVDPAHLCFRVCIATLSALQQVTGDGVLIFF